MTVTRGFVIILTSALGLGGAGALIGYALGVFAPGYYRGTFAAGRQPGFDPIAVGLGLGLSQGLIAGLLVGGVVVLAVTWYNSRRAAFEPRWVGHFPPLEDPEPRVSGEEGITERPTA